MDDSNDLRPPAKRPKRTDENGQHYDEGNGRGSSQTKRFARCTRNKVLCEVCSKPDCGKCSNCLNRASGHQACRRKPKDKCLSYIKMEKNSKDHKTSKVTSNFVAEITKMDASATTTTHVSRKNTDGDLVSSATANTEDKKLGNANGDLVSSDTANTEDKEGGNANGDLVSSATANTKDKEGGNANGDLVSSATANTKDKERGNANGDLVSSATVNTKDKEGFHTDPQLMLKYVSSQLSSLSSIVDKALQLLTENSTLSSCVTGSTSVLCTTSTAPDVHQKGTVFRSSITDIHCTSVSNVSQQRNAFYKTNTNALTTKCIPTSSGPVLSSVVTIPAISMPGSTSACARHVSASTVAISSHALSDKTSVSMLNGKILMPSLQPGFTKTVPASTSAAGPTSSSTGTRFVSTTTSSVLTSGSPGARLVSTITSSRLFGSTGTQPISIGSRLNSRSTDSNSASFTGSGRNTASTGFSMPTSSSSQSNAISITESVATSTVTIPVCASTISRPSPVSGGSRSHSGLISSRPIRLFTAAPVVTHTTQPIQSQSPVLQHLHLQTITQQTSLTQTPVSSPTVSLCLTSPTAARSFTSPTAFPSQSSLSANQCSSSNSAVRNDCLTPRSSLSVEATTKAKVMQIMKEAFSSLTIDLHVTKCGISGPPGTGKTHIKALLLNQDPPSPKRSSTALSTKAEEVTTAEFLVNSVEIRGGLRWTVLQKEHWARLLSNTIYNSAPPTDSSNQSTSGVGGNVETTSAVPFRDVSGMTYKLLLEKYKENKPKRKRSTMNKIHLIYFVDTGGQPQFQEILPNFVRSSINFLVHKLSEELDDCPGFEYWLNGNKYTIPEALRVSNMSIITQSVRSVCSSIRSEQCDQRSPTVAILGTFKDELKAQCGGDRVSMEDIIKNKGNSIEKKLQNYVGQGARKCSLMKCTRDSCIFPVDASEEGWESNSEVIKTLRSEVHAYSDKVQLKGIPLSYFVLLQNLKEFSRKQCEPFLDKSTLDQVIEQSHISLGAAQVEEALNLFADVNLILYFPSSSMLSNLIFVDPNFLYERVTEIIVASFDRFGSSTYDNNFNNTGIFTDLLLDTITSLNFTEYPSFTRQMFLSLLQDLFVIAEHKRGHYFMPCILKLENMEYLSPEIKNSMDDIEMYMNYNDVSGPLIISFGDKISPRGLFCAMVAKLSRNFGWRLNEGSNAVRCRNMIEFCVCNNKNNVVSPPLGTALLCDKLTHLEVYTTCEKVHCCNIRKAVLSSLYTAGSSLKYSFTAIDVHAGFYCNTCPAGSPKHHTIVSQREDSGMWQEKCSVNTRKRAVPLDSRQDVWFENPSSTVSTENYSRDESIPSIQQVIAELIPNTNKWFVIAVDLEIDLTEIERIRQDKDNETQRFIAVVEKWQKNGRPPFTWSTVVQVLTSQIVQEHSLADNIQKRYLLL